LPPGEEAGEAGGGGRRHRYGPRGGGPLAQTKTKNYESPITEIKQHTFNTGNNGHAAQLTELREKIATYCAYVGYSDQLLAY
jgi:hypothetical protein